MINGDIVLINRQPSLSKHSFMTHKVVIVPYYTMVLNTSSTIPYNADFDGDEMNIHVPQTIESIIECSQLNTIITMFISENNSVPKIGLIQDSLVGSYKITSNYNFFNKIDAMLILSNIENWNGDLPEPAISHPKQLWTGNQLISEILPLNFNYKNKNKDGKFVQIINGKVLTGFFDKNIVGDTKNSIFHILWLDYDKKLLPLYVYNFQNVINFYLYYYSHSLTYDDFIITDPVVNIEIEKIKLNCEYNYKKIYIF